MHMQLRRHIAQLTDVEFLNGTPQRRGDGADRRPGQDRFLDQLLPVGGGQMLQLTHAGLARNQHDPRPARVRLQPGGAQFQIAQGLGRGEDGGIEGEFLHGRTLSAGAEGCTLPARRAA